MEKEHVIIIITCNSEAQLQDISRYVNVNQHHTTRLFKSAANYSSFREVQVYTGCK